MLRIRNYFIALAVVFAISSAYALIGIQDAKAQEGSLPDLINRIEALESKGAGNVTAGKIRGLDIGFDVRHRFEARSQDFLSNGLTPTSSAATGKWTYADDGNRAHQTRKPSYEFTLQRVRLSFDADVNKHVRGYIRIQDVRTFGEEQSTGGNIDNVDLNEAYVELRNLGDLSSALSNVELRVGRWQAHYGNDRLIGTLNWANQSRSYDGARLKWSNKKNLWVDLFAFSIEETTTGVTDGGNAGLTTTPSLTDKDEVLYGLYSQYKFGGALKGVLVEPYMIVRAESSEEDVTAGSNTLLATETRYTAGLRLDGKNIAGLGGLDFTVEPAWQFGTTRYNMDDTTVDSGDNTIQSAPIQAWAIYAGTGYSFDNLPWSPRIGYAYVFASGDDTYNTGAAKTFDHIYPTGHAQLGYMDYAAWQNIEDHQIHFSLKPTKKLVIDTKVHFFELDEEEDSWYNVVGGTGGGSAGGQIIRRGADTITRNGVAKNIDDELGQEIDVTLKYKLFENFGVVAGYSHYFAGDFVEDTGAGVDRGVDWFYFQTTMKF